MSWFRCDRTHCSEDEKENFFAELRFYITQYGVANNEIRKLKEELDEKNEKIARIILESAKQAEYFHSHLHKDNQ